MNSSDASPAANHPSRKAGMVLFGDFNGVKHIVAPYTEGRFGNNIKYYGLGKGKVDAGEDTLDAAMRECGEETGIDIKKLLGEDAIAKLRHGEPVEDIDSGYAGVRIRRVMPNALEYAYLGRGGSPHEFAMFAIELEGIEHLQEHLKNPQNRSRYLGRPQEVYVPVRTMLAFNRDKYPDMQQCLDWLRTMHMPTQSWSGHRGGESLPRINGEGDQWFADLEASYMKKIGRPGSCIQNVSEWHDFQETLVGENYDLLTKHAEQIRKILIELGVITGKDDAILKFDTKDTPLVFYQEGADILTADRYLKSTIKAGLESSEFNLAFCGNVPQMATRHAPRMERIGSAQLAGVVWASGQGAIEDVANYYRDNPARTPADNSWLGGNMYDDSLRADLQGVLRNMQAKEVPIRQVLQAQTYGTVEPPLLQRKA